jgi:hypothetical protein
MGAFLRVWWAAPQVVLRAIKWQYKGIFGHFCGHFAGSWAENFAGVFEIFGADAPGGSLPE